MRLPTNYFKVTGATHGQLTPYWTKQLDKPILEARQLSQRGGALRCEWRGDKVILWDRAVTFMQSELWLD